MNSFEFELIFTLDHDENPEIYMDALYLAGCDDATVSVGEIGRISLDFNIKAVNAQSAIIDAYQKVLKAIPHADLTRAEPYLLNVTELAFQFGFSKQNMRKYVRGEIASIKSYFPNPAISGKTSYWHVAEVTSWLSQNTKVKISGLRIETLMAIWGLNQAIENCRLPDKSLMQDFEQMLKCVA